MIHTEQHGPITLIRCARSFLGRPISWAAAYYVDGLLIDCGPRCTESEILRLLESVKLKQIVLTHGHEDNIGALAAINDRYPDVPIYGSTRTVALTNDPGRLKLQPHRRLAWGAPRAVESVRLLDEVENRIETPNYLLRAIETPGHSAGHICYFEPTQRWLFSGDAYATGRDTAWTSEVNLFNLLGSLRVLAGLRPERLFPGSGNVRRTPQPEILEKIAYLTQLAGEVGKLEALGMSTGEISACLFESDQRLRFWTFGHHANAHLIAACSSYNELFFDAMNRSTRHSGTRSHALSDDSIPGASESTDFSDFAR
jgi:glyoxylase-like metal-dependent hydrolase (beta-lactamase superfamily II)